MMNYYWLLAPFALFAGYIALRTALQASILLWRMAMIVAVDVAEKMSRAIAVGVVEITGLAAFYAGRGIRWAASPLSRQLKSARSAKTMHEQKSGWEALTNEPDNDVVLARTILALPEGFTDADLKSRYRNLAKRVAGDVGGTDWLMTQVNWANNVLKGKL